MFNWLKKFKRAEMISQEQFDTFLKDPGFQKLVKYAKNQMIFSRDGDLKDDDRTASRFEEGKNYKYAIWSVQRWMDKRKVRISTNGVERAIARHMDPDGSGMFEDLVANDFPI